MKAKHLLSVALICLSGTGAFADEDITDRMQEGREFSAREAARAEREASKDRGHEGRLSIGEGRSLGGNVGRDRATGEVRGELNIKADHDVGGK